MIAERLCVYGENKPSFAIEMDVFKTSVGLFFDVEDLRKYVRKSFGIKLKKSAFSKTARAEAGAVYDDDDIPYFYMLFHTMDPPIGIVAHESVHVAGAICESLGIPVDRDNDETLAYMVDFLTQTTVDTIRDYDRRAG